MLKRRMQVTAATAHSGRDLRNGSVNPRKRGDGSPCSNASGCWRLTICGASGMTTSVEPGMRVCMSRPTMSAGERTSASP